MPPSDGKMHDEYEDFWNQYRPIYGPNTAIFLQVGSFYEFYDVQDPESGKCRFNVRDIVDFLGIQLTVRKGAATGGLDILFAGVPDYTLHKWAGKLTDAGWTVVVVDQVAATAAATAAPGRRQTRKVSRILSPGTHWENAAVSESPTIMGIWMSAGGGAGSCACPTAPPQFGAATFDLSTGITTTVTGTTKGRVDTWSSDDLVHYLQVHSPRELIFWWIGEAIAAPDEATLRRRLAYQAGAFHIRRAATASALDDPLARENFLREVYNIQSLLPVREWLGIGDPAAAPAESALAHLLLFVKEHLPSAFERLHKNRPWSPAAALRLGNNAATQLQIISQRTQDGVLGLFQGCLTPMGKRGIRHRLLTPTANHEILEERYTQITAILTATDQNRKNLGKLLRAMFDLPRLHRRMICAQTVAADIGCLHQSYIATELLAAAVPAALAPPPSLLEALQAWRMDVFQEEFSVEKAAAAASSEDITCLQTGPSQNEDIADLEARLAKLAADAQQFLQSCKNLAGVTTDALRLETREKQPYGIRGTPTALKAFRLALNGPAAGLLPPALKGADVTIQKSGGWLDAPWLETLNAQVQRLREKLAISLKVRMPAVCARVTEAAEATGLWRHIEEWIENVDITVCLATTAAERGYCRPQLLAPAAGEGSGLKATALRHPLIETIRTRTEYVRHNVELGAAATGWLVYGMNASGKSSLMKAIGIAVHLAQCGCFVPAAEFVIRPFRAIYTRILNQDNLWAGLSSFAVEMSEMRDILTAADEYTLVLGDELCAGTETTSAQALVAAGIEWLSARKARYVFATHLHGLLEILPPPRDLALAVWHLRVVYDPVHDRLIYDRTLTAGPGSTLYGLEVARAMHLPLEFLEKAHVFRRRLLGTVNEAEAEGSAWNSAVQRRACEMCGAGIVRDLEVHHIRPRAEAVGESKWFEDGAGRDDARNLIVVCQRCHDEHHAGRLDIQPLRQTSAGPMRLALPAVPAEVDFTKFNYKAVAVTPPPSSISSEAAPVSAATATATAATHSLPKSKWSADDQAAVMKMLRDFPNLSLKLLVFKLQHEYEIEISEATLRKIRKDGGF